MTDVGAPGYGLSVELRQETPFALAASFSVAPGELMALAGPSGSGKTTILRTIAGFHRPTEGRVTCKGAIWLDRAARVDLSPRRRRVGHVFQSYALFPHLTAAQNVMEALLDRPTEVRRDEAMALLSRIHLEGFEDRRPGQLSGGQQQRVAVARALARRPDVLLLDEPFSAVDRVTRKRLYAELSELRNILSMPVILVTHDLEEAARLADTATLLSRGKVVGSGNIETVFARFDLGNVIDSDTVGAIVHARIVAHDREAGITLLHHPAGQMTLPLLEGAIGSLVRLHIRARDVALAVGEIGKLSIRNRLSGVVAEIAERSPPVVEVRLDVGGEPLIARITRDALLALDLRVGQPVTALIKSMAFDRLADGA